MSFYAFGLQLFTYLCLFMGFPVFLPSTSVVASWTQVTYATSGAEIATLELDPTQSAQDNLDGLE